MSVGTRVQLRRDTAANWTTANPTLLAGEVGIELPAIEPGPMKFKVGDGTRPWTTLPYFEDVSLLLTAAGNLAGLADVTAARTNLGLGSAALHPAGDFDSAGTATAVVSTHAAAPDPHGDRAYSDAQLSTALAGLSIAEAPAATQGSGLTHAGVGQTIGGVTITAGMRVLDTANSVSAGLWVAQPGAWTRPPDFASSSNAQGKLVEVDTGGLWLCVATAAVTVDTTAQVWSEIDPGVLQFGSGLSKSGNTVSLALTKALVLATGLSAADVGADASGAATTAAAAAQAAAIAASVQRASNGSDFADADATRANLKAPVLRHAQCVATSNQALSGALPTIDSYAVQDGDRVLLTGQSTGSQNGMWIAHTAGWARPNDYPAGGVLTSRSCKVTGGTVYGGTDWYLASTSSITIDTTAVTWKPVNVTGVVRQNTVNDASLVRTALQAHQPLTVKQRSVLAMPNTWVNATRHAMPENAVYDEDTGLWVGVYTGTTTGGTVRVCYWTAPSFAAIKAGNLTDGGAVLGMTGASGPDAPHLLRDGATWYIAVGSGNANGTISLWSSTTSPAGAGSYSAVQASLITLGATAAIANPASAPTVTPTSGAPGTIAAGAHTYAFTALTAAGETILSPIGSGTLAAQGFNTISWSAVTGATGYNVYILLAGGTTQAPIYAPVALNVQGTSYQDNTGVPVSYSQQPPRQNRTSSFDNTRATEPYIMRIPPSDPLWAQGYRWAMYYMGFTASSTVEQIGVAVSASLNAAAWTKLNSGNPVIACGGGYTFDAEIVADPFVYITATGQIIVFYCAGEFASIANTGRCTLAAACSPTIGGTYTKLGTVIDSPPYPNVGSGNHASWSGTFPVMAGANGDEAITWRGALIVDPTDAELIWIYAGKQFRNGYGSSSTRGYVATIDAASPLFLGILAQNQWERVEVESGDPRWVQAGTGWANAIATNWSAGQAHDSKTVGDSKTFHFHGTGVRIGFGAASSTGTADIAIDGVYDQTLDTYNPDAANFTHVIYEKTGLTPGYHKVTLTVQTPNAGAGANGFVYVDYAERLIAGLGL